MDSDRSRPFRSGRRQHGYILVWFAAMMVVLLVFAGFAVDLGFWYLTGRNAQRTADSAALAGVVYREGDVTNNNTARDAALANAAENGYVTGEDDTTVTPLFEDAEGVELPLSQLRVQVERKAPSFFTRLLGFDGVDITRDAVAEYSPSPPLGSPSNVLGNQPIIGSDTSWIDDSSLDLGQSFWLDIQGPRTPTVEGDQYQTDRCNNIRIPQGAQGQPPPPLFSWIGPFDPEACNPVTGTNEYYEDGSGKDGYNYIVEVDDVDPDNPGTIDLEIFDPAFLDQGVDCQRYTIDGNAALAFGAMNPRNPLGIPYDVVSQLGIFTEVPMATPLRFSLATWNQRALPRVIGPIGAVAQAILDDGMLNPATRPTDPNISHPPWFGIYPAPVYNVTRWNLYATLSNYGITEAMLQDVVERFAPGPFEPGCTGDDSNGANLVLSPGLAFFACLFGGCGGGGWGGGTALDQPADITPIQPVDPGESPPIGIPGSPSSESTSPDPAIPFSGDSVFASPVVGSSATPLRPARTDMTQFDGLPETRFTISDANKTLREHDDNVPVPSCPGAGDDAATYGWYSPFVPTAADLATPWDDGGSGYFWNYVFNGRYAANVPALFDITFGNVRYGEDLTSAATFWAGGVHELGHDFRSTARQWVKPCGGEIPIDPNWITGDGKVQLVINVDTGIRDGGTTTQLCNSAATTCGRGGNRFSIRARHNGAADGVNVFAEGRLQLLGNFQGSTGNFWLTELAENDTRDRVLRLTFHDPGDIAVCDDLDGDGKVDPDPNPDDTISDVRCSPAGYAEGDADVPNDVIGTLRILQPDGTVFPDCEIAKVSDPDTILNPGDDCEITNLDYSFNGDLLEIRIDIPAGGFHCDGDPDVDPSACWVVAQFEYPASSAGQLVKPSDATTWSAILEGVPVRLVE